MHFKTAAAGLLGAVSMLAVSQQAMAETQITFMAFNMYGAGANKGETIDKTVAAIKAANADIISISETRAEGDPCTADSCPPAGESRAAALAKALGMNYYDQKGDNPAIWSNAVFSRYPIEGGRPGDIGVNVNVDGRKVAVYSVNLPDAPYQPYQVLNIPYGNYPFAKTADEAIKFAEGARGKSFDEMIADAGVAEKEGASLVLIGGDFNEPSHRDWTEGTVKAGFQPMPVAWPGTTKLEKAGFVDLYRAVYPDPVAKPGITWTPTTEATDPSDHHDRIDFVFARGATVKPLSAAVVGEKTPEADIVVSPWPSDHRAVIAKFSF
ncbi:endonuclease/exonuclease/phosphatase family protein [Oryzibacter oryziterrae]|uniref:endonuclease/exonuclease/phosphatase family protein n=1 Tax=Oryzibacter oryziterrae TaxID=2766474 RepID=UPI001F294046|nr:endonuclease/exonuclease/phosphatase family protein [Oryzibacter oryziterrae]